MPLTDEQRASDELVARIQKLKLDAFDSMGYYLKMSPRELEVSGHRTRTPEQAAAWNYKRAADEIESLIRAFERKYPG